MVTPVELMDRSKDAAYIAAALSATGNPVGEDAARRFWEERSHARGCAWIRLDNVGAADLRAAAEAAFPNG